VVAVSLKKEDPTFERRRGIEGLKPRAGRWPDSRQTEPCTGETPRASRGGFIAMKAVGGEGVKAFSRCAERKPGGGEAQEGRGSDEALTGFTDTALAVGSKALKSRARRLVTGRRVQRHEGMRRPG